MSPLLHPPPAVPFSVVRTPPPPAPAHKRGALPAAWRRLPDPCQRVGPKLRAGERRAGRQVRSALPTSGRGTRPRCCGEPQPVPGQIQPALGPGCLGAGGPSPAAPGKMAPLRALTMPRSPTPAAKETRPELDSPRPMRQEDCLAEPGRPGPFNPANSSRFYMGKGLG